MQRSMRHIRLVFDDLVLEKRIGGPLCLTIGCIVLSMSAFVTILSGAPKMSFNVAARYGIGVNSVRPEIADLDGDGALDVVTANGGQGNPSPTLTIRYGTGDGKFDSPVVIPSLMIGQTLAVGDLNNDGRPDIVAGAWYYSALGVWLNQGDRTFAEPYFTVNSIDREIFDLAIGDFDGDGKNDVVGLQDQIDQRLKFYHVSPEGRLTAFATLLQNSGGTSYEAVMEAGEINGDNRSDVILIGGGPFGTRQINFVFGQPPGGTYSMTPGSPMVDKAVSINVADLDNDGDNDFVVALLDTYVPNVHSLQPFRNLGGGNFTLAPTILIDQPFPPDEVATGDFNNDGKLDLAALLGSVYNNGVMVMIRNGNGDCTYVDGKYYAVASSTSISSADLNRDNRIDLITTGSFLDQTDYLDGNTLNVLLNNNSDGFPAPLVKLYGSDLIDAADFNNDGYLDLISARTSDSGATSRAVVSINDQHGGLLGDVNSPSSPLGLIDMQTGDFNGDGKADAVTAHKNNSRKLAVYFGNGNGNLSAPTLTSFAQPLTKSIVGDLNADGKDDVFVVDETGQGMSMLSVGDGTFVTAQSVSLPDSSGRIQKGDFNGDSKPDLLIAGSSDLRVWLNDGTGQFSPNAVSPPSGGANIVLGDFNGDGKLDFAGMADDGIKGVLGDGMGGFTNTFYREIEGTYSIILTKSTVAADFDMDGYDDVAMIMESNANGELIILLSGGTFWKPPVFPSAGVASRGLKAADFNGDGKPDLGWIGHNSRGVIYNTSITAATVSGRVEVGSRIAKALATLTDANGVVRTVRVGRGRFQFDNVGLGAVYTVAIQARGYTFVPQTVYVDDNLTLPDFVPSGGSRSDEGFVRKTR